MKGYKTIPLFPNHLVNKEGKVWNIKKKEFLKEENRGGVNYHFLYRNGYTKSVQTLDLIVSAFGTYDMLETVGEDKIKAKLYTVYKEKDKLKGTLNYHKQKLNENNY